MSLSRSHKCVVEEYIEGRELSADFWLFKDEAKLIGLTESIKGGNTENFTIVKSFYNPKNITKNRAAALGSIASSIGAAFGLYDMPLLLQTVENDDGLFALEFSARMGGGGKHDFIELMSGVDIKNIFLDMALNQKTPSNIKVDFCQNEAEIDYVYVNPRKFEKLQGFNDMLSQNIIEKLYIYKPRGVFMEKAVASSDRVCGVLIKGDKNFSIEEKRRIFMENCHVLNEYGEDIMKRDMWEGKDR